MRKSIREQLPSLSLAVTFVIVILIIKAEFYDDLLLLPMGASTAVIAETNGSEWSVGLFHSPDVEQIGFVCRWSTPSQHCHDYYVTERLGVCGFGLRWGNELTQIELPRWALLLAAGIIPFRRWVWPRLRRRTHSSPRLGIEGFRPIVRDKRFANVPKILETAKEKHESGRDWDAVNLEVLRGLM